MKILSFPAISKKSPNWRFLKIYWELKFLSKNLIKTRFKHKRMLHNVFFIKNNLKKQNILKIFKIPFSGIFAKLFRS